MAGWTPHKAEVFKDEFYRFLGNVRINSKEAGQIILGEHLYRAQHRFFDAVFTGLQADVHDFKHVKSRQLGISTGSRMLTVFWSGVHDGLRGSMVFDTGPHAEEARLELLDALEPLPRLIKFPRIERENRNLIQLSNGTRINFTAAGVKETKTSGTLGRSTGLNFCHCSEICSWAGGDGLVAFINALAQDFDNRLYIWESTGRGYNLWYEMYREAQANNHMETLFSGWWAKDNQLIRQDDPDWERYAMQPPTPREIKRMQQVHQQYGWKITREQLAWVRRNSNPNPEDAGDAPVEYEATAAQTAEQAWVEEDCFQLPGANFFSSESLQKQATKNVLHKFTTYAFFHGVEFSDLRVERARNSRAIELKVWEEPIEDSVYILTADPAFGYNENNDRSAIQVLRAYADGLEQVAEYAWPLITTDQFAHVILAIAAWYAGERSEIYLMVELNGPGDAVWKEIRQTMTKIRLPYYAAKMHEKGLTNIFQNVRHYVYTRSDSMGGGRSWQWKCLALDTPLPTPDGWTTMGDVRAHDWLLDETGHMCRVLHTTDPMDGHECYRITFDDKSSIVADDEHLWQVSTYRNTERRIQVVPTTELIPGEHTIHTALPLDLSKKDLHIHPYILGVWLGDGQANRGKFFSSAADINEISQHLADCGAVLGPKKIDRNGVVRRLIEGLTVRLGDLNVLGNKHIPPLYLRASEQQRMELLRGLMDTDGSIDNTNSRQCSFTTSNPLLAEGFAELLRTVGIKPKFCMRERNLLYKGEVVICQPAYQFAFTSHPDIPYFKLDRKLSRQAYNGHMRPGHSRHHKIVSVEKVESVPVKCIQVDSPSRLYLAGHGMVPTHNTNPTLKETLMNHLQSATENGTLIIRSIAALEEMKSVQRDGASIEATGSAKDDRVVTLAMGVLCWFERVRQKMTVSRRTSEFEHAKHSLSVGDRTTLFSKHMMDQYFATKMVQRRKQAQAGMARQRWGRRR